MSVPRSGCIFEALGVSGGNGLRPWITFGKALKLHESRREH